MSMSGASRAVGVEEALEQQVVFQRIDVAELQHVADHGAASRAAGAARDAVLDGEAHEVPDDQEIAGEAHPADDAQFVLQPVEHCLRRACRRSGRARLPRTVRADIASGVLPSGGVKTGKCRFLKSSWMSTAVGDLLAALDGVVVAGEELDTSPPAGGRRTDRCRSACGCSSAAHLAGVDAQQHVVGRRRRPGIR